MGDNLYKTTGEFRPDKLIADNKIPVTTKGVLVAAGQGLLKRGTVLGRSSSGEYKITGTGETSVEGEGTDAKTATNMVGCDCILAEDVDTTDTEAVAAAYATGAFNRGVLILAEGAEIDSYETELRKLGIFLKTVQEY